MVGTTILKWGGGGRERQREREKRRRRKKKKKKKKSNVTSEFRQLILFRLRRQKALANTVLDKKNKGYKYITFLSGGFTQLFVCPSSMKERILMKSVST
jgi:hypothetical protein